MQSSPLDLRLPAKILQSVLILHFPPPPPLGFTSIPIVSMSAFYRSWHHVECVGASFCVNIISYVDVEFLPSTRNILHLVVRKMKTWNACSFHWVLSSPNRYYCLFLLFCWLKSLLLLLVHERKQKTIIILVLLLFFFSIDWSPFFLMCSAMSNRPKHTTHTTHMSSGPVEDEEGEDCEVCYTMKASVIFLPCNHCFVCEDCCIKMKKCLKCRAVIEEKKRSGWTHFQQFSWQSFT
jgi:hypothetical protein